MSIQVDAGSCTVTPASCQRRTMRALSSIAAAESCTRSLMPASSHGSATGTASIAPPAARIAAAASVR
jgi:hypothetical protein